MIKDTPWVLLLIVLSFCLGCIAALRARRSHVRRKIQKRNQIAFLAEFDAIDLLQRNGYTVLSTQCVADHTLVLDGHAQTYSLKADILAERKGKHYVAEVKTGAFAPKLDSAATRRQLLEYYVAFDVDGVLLVNMAEHRVHELEFSSITSYPQDSKSRVSAIAFGVTVGIILTLILCKYAHLF